MREYGKINTRFWADTKMLRLTVNARFMAVYLLTGPHTNSVGCFRLPSGYIAADFRWDANTVRDTVAELVREGFIIRSDDEIGWTFIVNFLRYNPIENPNVGKAAMLFIEAVPTDVEFYPHFINALKPYAERFPKGFLQGCLKGIGNGLANGMPNREPEPEPYPEPEPEKGEADAETGLGNGFALEDLDTDAALLVWNDLAIELGLAQVQKLTDARKIKLRARLRDTGGVAGWAATLVKIRDSRFLRGDNSRSWRADFDFVLQEKSFNKLREGAYGDKKTPEATVAPPSFTLAPDIVATLKAADFTDDEIKRWFDDAAFFDGGKRIVVKTGFIKDRISTHFDAKLRRAFGDTPIVEVAAPTVSQPP